MNLGAGRTELRNRGFDYLTDARCDLFLNTSKDAIEDVAPWPWLETTTTGTSPLTIPDLKSVLYVADTTQQLELVGRDFRDILDWDPALTIVGPAQCWVWDGEFTIKTWPNTAELYVRYAKRSPALADPGDTPLIPAMYHGVWIDRAVVEALKDSDNLAEAMTLLQYVEDVQLARMLDVYINRNFQNAPQQRMHMLGAQDGTWW